jgi:hypothetical protein
MTANLRLPGIGWCQTRLNNDQTQVQLHCMQVGYASQCMAAYLLDPVTGQRNPDIHGCLDNDSPWFGRYKPLDTTTFAGANMSFRDPSGLIHYPVTASQLQHSVVRLRTYQPMAYFTRTLVIRGIRLSSLISRRELDSR